MPGKNGAPFSGQQDEDQRLFTELMNCAIPIGIYFKDLRRRYIRLNAAEANIIGCGKPQAAVGKTADTFLSARRARAWRQEETELLVMGEPIIERLEEVRQDDGTVRWFSATKVPIYNDRRAIIGLFGTTRDITGSVIEEQRKRHFLATMSHEMRTPVTAISGALSMVISGAAGALPDPAKRLLAISNANCRRLNHLINDILDLEKAGAGRMVFDFKPVDVVEAVEQEIASMQSYAQPHDVGIRFEGPRPHAMVRADWERLAQVLSNLLSNAVKFSPRNTDVLVGVEVCADTVRITVRDHGPGIPDVYRDHVFDKFTQVRNGDGSHTGGSGLGLSIVKEIVGRLKGDVGFDPAPGGGTVFWVDLPRCEEPRPESPAQEDETPAQNEKGPPL
jgi:PAS domain S-box-containing protein